MRSSHARQVGQRGAGAVHLAWYAVRVRIPRGHVAHHAVLDGQDSVGVGHFIGVVRDHHDRGAALVHAFDDREHVGARLRVEHRRRFVEHEHAAVHGEHFAYADGAPVIDDLTVGIERGSTVALVGPNGSGKTTFARLLCALIAPDEGTICVEALRWHHAKRRQRKALRRSLGLIMQRPERQLFAATVREDVAYGPRNQGLDERTDP